MILQTYYRQNTPCCCLTTGMEPRIFAQSTITDYLHDAGFRITQDSSVQPFYLSETAAFFNDTTQKEEMTIVLPFTDVQPLPLFAAESGMERGETLRELYRLFDMLLAVQNTGAISESFFRAAMAAPLCLLRNTASGDLIILPPQLVQRCTAADPETALAYHYPYIHPNTERLSILNAAYFFLSALSYRCLAAAAPFNAAAVPFADMDSCIPAQKDGAADQDHAAAASGAAETKPAAAVASGAVEQLVQNIRDGVYIPIALRCPGLAKNVSTLIDGGLWLTKQTPRGVLSGCEQLCAYRDTTLPLFYTDQTEHAGNSSADSAHPVGSANLAGSMQQEPFAAFITAERKRISRTRSLRKNAGKLVAATAGIILLLAAVISIVQAINKPPETAGLSPAEVVHGFYAAVGALDQARVTAYTKRKAASEYDDLLVHLFVTSKMREAYERKKIYYTPQEFLTLCTAVHTQQAAQNADSQTDTPAAESERYKDAVIAALNGGALYGISQLSIVPAQGSELFDVTFYYWVPLFSSEKTAALMDESEAFLTERSFFPLQILHYHDRVHVTASSGSYFIGEIEAIERKPVIESSDSLIKETLLPPAEQPDYLSRL